MAVYINFMTLKRAKTESQKSEQKIHFRRDFVLESMPYRWIINLSLEIDGIVKYFLSNFRKFVVSAFHLVFQKFKHKIEFGYIVQVSFLRVSSFKRVREIFG